MLKKLFYTTVQVILIIQLVFPVTGYASDVRSGTALDMPLDNWGLGMRGVKIHDDVFVSLPDQSLQLSFVDLVVTGIGFPLRLERIYTGRPHPKGALGKEWMLGIESWVDQSTKNRITIIDADGSAVFNKDDQGVFRDGSGAVVTKNANQSLLLTEKNAYTTLYSKSGQPVRMVDPNGNTLEYKYKAGKLASLEESSGRKLLFFYNTRQLLEEVSDDAGRAVAFRYDNSGRLVSVKRFGRQTTTIDYNSNSYLSRIGLPNGLALSVAYETQTPSKVRKITSNRDEHYVFEAQPDTSEIKVYDHSGNTYYYSFYRSGENIIIAISNGSGWLTGYRLDSSGHLAAWQRPDGNLVRYQHDSYDRLLGVSDDTGVTVGYKYRGLTNKPSKIVDSQGKEMSFDYDSNGSLISIASPGQEAIELLRHSNGMVREYKRGDTAVSSISIDSHGNPVAIQNAATGKTTKAYDPLGRMIGEQLGAGAYYKYRYNDFDQITHILRDRDLLAEYSYDSVGNLQMARDMEGRVFQYAVDEDGRVEEVTTPGNKVFAIKRTANGYQSQRLFPNKASKTYSYNHAGRVTRIEDSFGKYRQFKWTPSLQLDREINEDGSFVRYKYDNSGRLIEKVFSSGESHTFSYRGDQLISIASPRFKQEYGYDKQGRVSTMEDKVLGLTVRWDYDRFGRVKAVSSRDIGKIEYQYDQAGRIKTIIDPDSEKTQYSYDLSGRVKEIKYPNGVDQKYSYNEKINAVSSISVMRDKKNLFHESYLYNDDGLLKESRNKLDRSSKAYTYNPETELVSYIRTSANSASKQWSYSYDDNGNMIEEVRPDGKISSEYEGIARITKHGSGRIHHDSRGNLTTAVVNRDKFNFDYDHTGKLGKAELPDGSFKEYRYDPLGRLIFYKKDGDERHIVWNGNTRLFELDRGKNLVKFYVQGPGLDDVVSVRTEEKMYFHQDRIGSVRLVTGNKGKIISAYDYTPFGEPVFKPSRGALDGIVFAGRPYDDDIECYYLRARFYCPGLKRFLTRDPREGVSALPLSWNPYLYAINNPVNFNDPDGEVFAVIGGAIVYGLASLVAFGSGYLAGTAINETYHGGKRISEIGLKEYAKEKIQPAVDLADTASNMGLHSYSAAMDGEEGEQEAVQTRIGNTKKFVESIMPMNRFEKEVLIQSNPNEAQRVKEHNENLVGYFNESANTVAEMVTDAATGEFKGAATGALIETNIGSKLDRLQKSASEVPGLNSTVGMVSGELRGAGALVLAEPEKDTNQPEALAADRDAEPSAVTDAEQVNSEAATSSVVSNRNTSDEKPLFSIAGDEETRNEEPIFSIAGSEEASNESSLFSIAGNEETKLAHTAAAPSIDCSGLPGSISIQGQCICTDGLVYSPSRSRCIACSEYYEVVRSLADQGALDVAQATINEARECTSLTAQMQSLVTTARQQRSCGPIAASLRSACQGSDAQTVNAFMSEAIEKNCTIDGNLWSACNSVIAKHKQRIAAQERLHQAQAEAEAASSKAAGWLDVMTAVAKEVQKVQSRPDKPSGGRPLPTGVPQSDMTMPPMPGSEGTVFEGVVQIAGDAARGRDYGNTGSEPGAGSTPATSPSTGGMSPSACEMKFCPVCAKGSAGVDLMGVAVNPQCTSCRNQNKGNIESCISGDSSSGDKGNAMKTFNTYSVLECKKPLEDYKGRITGYHKFYEVTGPDRDRRPPAGITCRAISKGSWKVCLDKARDLNEKGNTHYSVIP